MNTFPQIEKSIDILQSKLGDLLKDHNPKLSVKSEGDYPLLIMETQSDSAGFTIVDDSPESSYNSAYSLFKTLYKENHNLWKTRNLSFIVFAKDDLKKHEDFFTDIQSDVYFCRKYIGQFQTDNERLEEELRHLPFLPLDENYPKDLNRPISAQNLIQSLGISSKLSRNIVVSGQRSAKRIIEDLKKEVSDLPEIGKTSISQKKTFREPISQTRVKKMTIKGFRAYNREQEFDLDADIIVLYGPNGLGKTSFFDALDYVSTGRIGRLRKHFNNHEDFKEIASNLSSKSSGFVSLEINQGDSQQSIFRNIDDWSYALFNDEKLDRPDILQKLTLARWDGKRERVEILEKLFRATHLFSQSNAELLTEFETNSKLSSDIVSRALALEDYASGQSKLTDVISLLNKSIKKNNKELNDVRINLEKLESQREKLPNPKDHKIGPKLLKLSKELQSEISKLGDFEFDYDGNSEITKEIVREWRSLITAKLEGLQDKLDEIDALKSDLDNYKNDKNLLSEEEKKEENINITLKNSLSELHGFKADLDEIEIEITDKRELINSCNTEIRKFNSVSKLLNEKSELQKNLKKKAKDIQKIKKSLPVIESKYLNKNSDLIQLLKQKESVKDEFALILERIKALEEIKDKFDLWVKTFKDIEELQNSIDSKNSRILVQKNQIQKHKNSLNELEEEYIHVKQNSDKLTTQSDSLTKLLDEIEKYVDNGSCPVCGIDHNSKSTLLNRIRKQKEARPNKLSKFINKSNELFLEIKRHKESLNSITHSLELNKKELNDNKKLLGELKEFIENFNLLIEHSGSDISQNDSLDLVNEILSRYKRNEIELRNRLKDIQESEHKVIKIKRELEAEKDTLSETQEYILNEIQNIKVDIQKYLVDIEAEGISGDTEIKKINSWLKDSKERKNKFNSEISILLKKKDGITAKVRPLEKQNKKLKLELAEIRSNVEILKFRIFQYESKFNELVPEGEIISQTLSDASEELTDHIKKFKNTINKALTLERALDSAELSAMIADLDSKVKHDLSIAEKTTEEIANLEHLLKWITNLKKLLKTQNSNAVENHVNTLGPLSSVIQKRLRTVYGFGDISLYPEHEEIRVEVDWNGIKKKPTDYFSDSQKQILMLSLFLSGRLTQTWSGFSPILLDDPVTHFDDLNAYGFVELIRGLVSTAPGKRQFIISTCEERLFELMKKKFRQVDGGAKFYRFQSINESGPIISKVN